MTIKIPGNKFSETKIDSDTSIEWLRAERKRIVDSQAANLRSNPRYVSYVRALDRAIAARIK